MDSQPVIFYEKVSGATEIDLAHAENELGVQLPSAYRSLLLSCNGGSCRLGLRIDGEDYGWPGVFYGVGEVVDSLAGRNADFHVVASEQGIEAGHLVVFANDGHVDYCFNYQELNSQGEPKIVFFDFELDISRTILDSFEAFLASLVEED